MSAESKLENKIHRLLTVAQTNADDQILRRQTHHFQRQLIAILRVLSFLAGPLASADLLQELVSKLIFVYGESTRKADDRDKSYRWESEEIIRDLKAEWPQLHAPLLEALRISKSQTLECCSCVRWSVAHAVKRQTLERLLTC